MKFGVFPIDIDHNLPIKNGRYSLTDVTMATGKTLKLGLIHSNCRTIGRNLVCTLLTSIPGHLLKMAVIAQRT